MSGQSVEPLDEVEHEVKPRSVEPAGPQLGQVGDGVADVAGRDVRERLRHGVDLGRRHPQGSPDVTDRVPDPVAVHHRDTGDPLTPEPGEDLLVDLGAPGRLDVDVDVGQLGPQRRAEPLHQQAVAHRVDPGDAEEVVDERARSRPTGGHPDPHLPDEVAHRGDGQEVRRVAETTDDRQLVIEPGQDRSELAR